MCPLPSPSPLADPQTDRHRTVDNSCFDSVRPLPRCLLPFFSRALLFLFFFFDLIAVGCCLSPFLRPDDADHFTAVPGSATLLCGEAKSLRGRTRGCGRAGFWCRRTGLGWRCAEETRKHDYVTASLPRVLSTIRNVCRFHPLPFDFCGVAAMSSVVLNLARAVCSWIAVR